MPFSSQFSPLKPILELFWILRIRPKREKEKNLNLVFRHRRAFKPQPEITWIVQILSKKLRHSLFYVFWLNIGLRAYWVTSILPEANFVRLLCLNTRYRVYSMIDQKHSKRPPTVWVFYHGKPNDSICSLLIFSRWGAWKFLSLIGEDTNIPPSLAQMW